MRRTNNDKSPSQSYYNKHEGSFKLLAEENQYYTPCLKSAIYGNAGAVALAVSMFIQNNCKWYWIVLAILSFVIGYIIGGLSYKIAGLAQGQYKFAMREYEDDNIKSMKRFNLEGDKLRMKADLYNNLSFFMLFVGTVFSILAFCLKNPT